MKDSAALLPDAKTSKNLIKNIFGGRNADDFTQRVQCVFEIDGHQFGRTMGPETLHRNPGGGQRPFQGQLVTEVGDDGGKICWSPMIGN